MVVKAENNQRTGSCKLRGAYNAVALLEDEVRVRGVIGASSGNHGQALALAARLFEAPATVVMPEDAPVVKRQAVEELGATILTYDRFKNRRDAVVVEHARRHGMAIVPSANSRDVIAGAGTAALEMLQDRPDLVAIVVPVGGGGLAAGTALAAHAHNPSLWVVGVEPAVADDTRRSVLAGRPVTISPPVTIADGLGHTEPARMPWEINKRLLHDVLSVSEEAIADAMAWLWRHYRSVAEPSAAAGFAGLLACLDQLPRGPVGVICSGGNIGWTAYQALLTPALDRMENARAAVLR